MSQDIIFNLLQDEKSKHIYQLRKSYSETGNYDFIRQLVSTTEEANTFRSQIQSSCWENIVIWGTGFCGQMIQNTFSDIKWTAFIDNNPTVSSLNGLPVLSGEDFLCNPNALIVIGTIQWRSEIEKQLLSSGIQPSQIINAGQLMCDLENKQYFDLEFLPLEKEEIFFDAGCFDGATSENFIKWSKGNSQKIYALEPDRIAYETCVQRLSDYPYAIVHNYCAWNENTFLSFDEKGSTSSCITNSGNATIPAKTIDDILCGSKVTFIKMDIEGAEANAILGAKNTISTWKPKLAICVYHNMNDYHNLAEQILSLNPNYKFYLRHYSFRDAETVLYAI